ncbi:hypothetical protein DVH24_042103 [Malus domestica]|uniref:Uncharacterized protein n=1 Tax=Malus domestica TaxID=3750 RepID=A0A498IT40_MALDO|nr:hypothetical protein DVH24_042103 [Malus domestica]
MEHDRTEWDMTGWNRTEREQRWPRMETKRKKNETERGVRWNENSPKTRPVEHRVPSVLGAPNVGQNVSSHFVLSHSTYQMVLNSLKSCQ